VFAKCDKCSGCEWSAKTGQCFVAGMAP
jgi:hypothetical protein